MNESEEQQERIKMQCRAQLIDVGLINLSFGILFLAMSIDINFYENEECIFLREKGLDFGIALLIISIFSFGFGIFMKEMEFEDVLQVYKFFTFLTLIIGLIFFVLLLVFYCLIKKLGVRKGEPCGALRILSIVYLVLVVFSLFCFLLVICCLVLLTANND